ncbi:MAG: bifunctional non-ous end joining protein LigD [Actinomycetota bacterium]|jgi:bifunctional non-homologous end joining protein LigD|nr:bifunctional non-ous end joining protein LigD [Actinomycetota bacterium]
MASKKTPLKVGRRVLEVSNLDKVFYPSTGFTKGDTINYYREIAPVLLPHLKGRLLTLKRYPDGVDGMFFYEKNCPKHRPEWIKTAPMIRRQDGVTVNYCVLNDEASLVWAANLASIELHTTLAKATDVTRPTALVFDLDPGPPADILDCVDVALWLKKILASHDLDLFPKTSGSKGLQVFAPLNTKVTYEQTKAFAHELALQLEREHPDQVLSKPKKAEREGKVFVDWSQNDNHKTTVSVYSLRAREEPTASTPVSWAELTKARKAGDPALLAFEAADVLRRVAKRGDLFDPVRTLKQKLPS